MGWLGLGVSGLLFFGGGGEDGFGTGLGMIAGGNQFFFKAGQAFFSFVVAGLRVHQMHAHLAEIFSKAFQGLGKEPPVSSSDSFPNWAP